MSHHPESDVAAADAVESAPAPNVAGKPLSGRGDYRYWMTVQTRWSDNDALGHINNVVYMRYFEAVVVRFVIEEAALDWQADPAIPYAAEVLCRFAKPLSFPVGVDAGLRVARLGTRSVTYAIGLFAEGALSPAAEGHFVHVFVDRVGETPVPIPSAIRAVYERFT